MVGIEFKDEKTQKKLKISKIEIIQKKIGNAEGLHILLYTAQNKKIGFEIPYALNGLTKHTPSSQGDALASC